MESVGASRKVFEYMCRAPKVLNNGTRKTPVKGKIEFDQVTFWYPSRPNNIVLKVFYSYLFFHHSLVL